MYNSTVIPACIPSPLLVSCVSMSPAPPANCTGHYPHTQCRRPLASAAAACMLSAHSLQPHCVRRHAKWYRHLCCCCANDERWCWGVGWYVVRTGAGSAPRDASRVVRTSPSSPSPSPSPSDRRRHTTYRRPLASRYPSPLSLPPAAACRLPLPPPLSERRGTWGGGRHSSQLAHAPAIEPRRRRVGGLIVRTDLKSRIQTQTPSRATTAAAASASAAAASASAAAR
jgi:hypothetical protein